VRNRCRSRRSPPSRFLTSLYVFFLAGLFAHTVCSSGDEPIPRIAALTAGVSRRSRPAMAHRRSRAGSREP
jgi:hypothetical protein